MLNLTIPRSDSYWASLSPSEQEQLQALLEDFSMPLSMVREAAPKFGAKHKLKGKLPSQHTLGEIRGALRIAATQVKIEATAKLMQAVRGQIGGRTDDETLDAVLLLVGQEVIQQTLEGEDPKNRTAAARLLLKRKDQQLLERRIAHLEAQAAKADQAKVVTADTVLTPEEKQARYRQIFGMS